MSKLYIIDDKSHIKTKVFMDYKTESHRHFYYHILQSTKVAFTKNIT